MILFCFVFGSFYYNCNVVGFRNTDSQINLYLLISVFSALLMSRTNRREEMTRIHLTTSCQSLFFWHLLAHWSLLLWIELTTLIALNYANIQTKAFFSFFLFVYFIISMTALSVTASHFVWFVWFLFSKINAIKILSHGLNNSKHECYWTQFWCRHLNIFLLSHTFIFVNLMTE